MIFGNPVDFSQLLPTSQFDHYPRSGRTSAPLRRELTDRLDIANKQVRVCDLGIDVSDAGPQLEILT